ncbi:hypothetical protein AMK29_15560 [Streptomyces sp. CB02261]|nr:hypothetical protein AMK29_15560 [Streptomyces sp. CB02261]
MAAQQGMQGHPLVGALGGPFPEKAVVPGVGPPVACAVQEEAQPVADRRGDLHVLHGGGESAVSGQPLARGHAAREPVHPALAPGGEGRVAAERAG